MAILHPAFDLAIPPVSSASAAIVLLVCAVANLAAWSGAAGAAQINSVFVIAMENHNWTQPTSDTAAPHQIFNNGNAPFINSIVNKNFNGGMLNPQVTLFGEAAPISVNTQVSYATAYHNVLATPSGANPHIHPSEPSYIWAEAGTNFGVANDNTPYGAGGNNQSTTAHLSAYLQDADHSWKSYQEDIDTDSAGYVLPQNQWVSPITNRSGTYATVANSYNGSKRYDYAVKHNPQAFFTDTNGGNDATPANLAAQHYAPLQQLQLDLNSNSVAQYNWVTPNQYNDMHTALSTGYKGLTGDNAAIKQGDDFLAGVIPMIMASSAYKNNGLIIIWNDESEGANADDFSHTLMEIVISPLAKGNGYASSLNYTHSSDLRTMQEIFQVGPLLRDAATDGALDLSDLFLSNTIPAKAPRPGDFDEDSAVVGSDLELWRGGFGTASGATHIQGDANGDSDVDGGDFLIWQRQVGSSTPAVFANALVPEPPTSMLFIVGASCMRRTGARMRRKLVSA